jgi:hypothetical protein
MCMELTRAAALLTESPMVGSTTAATVVAGLRAAVAANKRQPVVGELA